MGEITNNIDKHPRDPDRTMRDVLHDVVARNGFERKLIRFDVGEEKVKLVYQTPT
jgi:hypothetical protein